MIAKHAWLTTPEPGRYILNFQLFGSEEVTVIEVGPDHMRNIVADGVHTILRSSFHRVPVHTNTENADERAGT
jgi:hypothetical protein